MTVSRDRLDLNGENVVRGVSEVFERFQDGATELMNQLVARVGDVAKQTDTNRGESG